MISKKIIIFTILFIVLALVLYYLPEIHRTALAAIGFTEMSATVFPSFYLYDIVVECQEGVVNPNQYVSANITITNQGIFEGDVQVDFWIEDVYETNYTSGSSLINILQDQSWSSTKSLLIPSFASAGIYHFKVNISAGTYSSTAFCTFEVQVPSGGASAGGELPLGEPAGKKVAEMEVTYKRYPIVVVGIPKEYEIEIKNSGNMSLHNLTLYLQGLELGWYSTIPEKVEELKANRNAVFKIEYVTPETAETKNYPITISIKSDELERSIYLVLKVVRVLGETEFEEKRQWLEDEIDIVERKLVELEEGGVSVDAFNKLLSNAKGKLELAKMEIKMGNLPKASELIYEAEFLVDTIKNTISEIEVSSRIRFLMATLPVILGIVFVLVVIRTVIRKPKQRKRG